MAPDFPLVYISMKLYGLVAISDLRRIVRMLRLKHVIKAMEFYYLVLALSWQLLLHCSMASGGLVPVSKTLKLFSTYLKVARQNVRVPSDGNCFYQDNLRQHRFAIAPNNADVGEKFLKF